MVTTLVARRKLSTTVYITPEQDAALKLLHARTQVPIAVYIREGIDLVLERHREKLPGQVDLGLP
jgi:predicted DNA-binding protein